MEELARVDGAPQSVLKNGSKMMHIVSEEGFVLAEGPGVGRLTGELLETFRNKMRVWRMRILGIK